MGSSDGEIGPGVKKILRKSGLISGLPPSADAVVARKPR
jgi:hypothetical protein